MFILIVRLRPLRWFLKIGHREYFSDQFHEVGPTRWLVGKLDSRYLAPRRIRVTNVPGTVLLGVALILLRHDLPRAPHPLRRSLSDEDP